jgi:hypothetical protein
VWNVAPATFDVTVTNPDGSTDRKASVLNVIFNVPPAPQVDEINPHTAYHWVPKHGMGVNLACRINISGSNFAYDDHVKLTKEGMPDVVLGSLKVHGQTMIHCAIHIPQGPSYFGYWDVVVTDAQGNAGTFSNGFRITDVPPTISSISPNSAPNNSNDQSFTIVGTGFKQGAKVAITRKFPSPVQGEISHNTGGSGGHSTNVWAYTPIEKMIKERHNMIISDISPTQIIVSLNLLHVSPYVYLQKCKYILRFDVEVQNPDGGIGTLKHGFTVTQVAETASNDGLALFCQRQVQ